MVVVSRCGGGVKIWWWCQDMVVSRYGGVKIWWWCQDVVVVSRGSCIFLSCLTACLHSRRATNQSGETLVWMPSSLVGANALMWLHLEAS